MKPSLHVSSGVDVKKYDYAVIGGGIFGVYSALTLAKQGYSVVLLEKSSALMQRASFVNQARLHSGLHYPRSLSTAIDARTQFQHFIDFFGRESIMHFRHIYGVSKFNTKTGAEDFEQFINRLGAEVDEVNKRNWFNPGTISKAFEVNEPSFDINTISHLLFEKIRNQKNLSVRLNSEVINAINFDSHFEISSSDGSFFSTEKVAICTYAETNSVRNKFKLDPIPVKYELTELILGKSHSHSNSVGFTVMDGPFFSLMPFGKSGYLSLSNVGLTPIASNFESPKFNCQDLNPNCNSRSLANCNVCEHKPQSLVDFQLMHLRKFIIPQFDFTPEKSIFTIKTTLSYSELDDSRPTAISWDLDNKLITVLSGKVSTLFELDAVLR